MIYSVWNQGAWKYDYYESRQTQDTANAPAPRHMIGVAGAAQVGLSPDQAAWPLPPDAVKVSSGEHARGRIARRFGLMPAPTGGLSGHLAGRVDGLSGIPIVEDVPLAGLLAAAGLAAWWWTKKRRGRRR